MPLRSRTAPLASALAERGIATWNVEYRRSGDSGGGWPGTFLDRGAAALIAAGDRVEVLDVENGGHFDIIAPGTNAWKTVGPFVRDCRAPSSRRPRHSKAPYIRRQC